MDSLTPLLPYLAPILTFIGTLIAVYFTQRWTLSRELARAKWEQRIQAYRELMGIKVTTQQIYVSRFEALIFSDYHETRWKLAGAPQQSIDLEEARRWMQKSEDYVHDITRNNQRLFETLASISILFPKTGELTTLIDRLYNFQTPTVQRPSAGYTHDQLEAWKVSAVQQLQDLVTREYSQPISSLINLLARTLEEEESRRL